MQLVNVSNVNSLSSNIWIGIFPLAALLFLKLLNNFSDIIGRVG